MEIKTYIRKRQELTDKIDKERRAFKEAHKEFYKQEKEFNDHIHILQVQENILSEKIRQQCIDIIHIFMTKLKTVDEVEDLEKFGFKCKVEKDFDHKRIRYYNFDEQHCYITNIDDNFVTLHFAAYNEGYRFGQGEISIPIEYFSINNLIKYALNKEAEIKKIEAMQMAEDKIKNIKQTIEQLQKELEVLENKG